MKGKESGISALILALMHFMLTVECENHSRRKHHSTSKGVYVLNQKDLVVVGSKDSILRLGKAQ